MRDLILTGFMGTGKTTVGRAVADRYGLEFVDMDAEIERRAGQSVPAIFASLGEAEFRRIETDVLRELLAGSGRVIATGGGTLVQPHNRDLLDPDRRVICLTCEASELQRRLADASGRPLLAGRSRGSVLELLDERRAAYDRFEQLDTTRLTEEEAAALIGERADLACFGLQFDARRTTAIVFERSVVNRLGRVMAERDIAGAVMLVTDDQIMRQAWMAGVIASLRPRRRANGLSPLSFATTELSAGEEHKTLESVLAIYRNCMACQLERSSTIAGIGGGVVGDVAGFAAATYLRGVRLVLVPTTLLAQVDAAVGGKVGVDVDGAKNMVGAFHPARLVVVDPSVLSTLPRRQLADGLVEIVKIGAMRSAALLERVEQLPAYDEILRVPAIIRRAIELKARVVEADPYETTGTRALLNFGHTVGHAIEAASGYRLSHGQAISIGMVAETRLAEDRGDTVPGMTDRLAALLDRFGLPVVAEDLDAGSVHAFMQQDKKRRDGRTRFAVPAEPGMGMVVEVDEPGARAAIRHALGAMR